MPIKSRMKLCMIIVGVVIYGFGCACAGSKGPGIKLDREIYDFGEVPEMTSVPYTFTVTNTGTEILTIKDIVLSCWCLRISAFDRIIEPGKSGTIAGTVHTEGFQGNITKTITLKTNIAGKEPLLTIEGKVLAKVEIMPLPISFGEVKQNTRELNGEVRLKNLTEHPMRITGVVTQNKNTDVAISTVEPDTVFSLRITVRPPYKTGNTREEVIVKTNLTDAPELTVLYDYSYAE